MMAPSKRLIRPIDIGGVAGGAKFIAKNILFKFSRDVLLDKTGHWLYGGSTRYAQMERESRKEREREREREREGERERAEETKRRESRETRREQIRVKSE